MPRVADSLLAALRYSLGFSYPLTLAELHFWQISTQYPVSRLKQAAAGLRLSSAKGYYYLPGYRHTVGLRLRRQKFSRSKWDIAVAVSQKLARLPLVEAIFVTGSLSMNNCTRFDDIDLMIITSPHTLWITRFVVYLYLSSQSLRRPPELPEHSSLRVNNKICDNLYLDTNNLLISTDWQLKTETWKLYAAHEILQAKCLFDRGGIHHAFLSQNSWVKNHLPIAYRQTLKSTSKLTNLTENWLLKTVNFLLYPLNLLFFVIQFIYMLPKRTSERVSLGYVFFHPRGRNQPSGL